MVFVISVPVPIAFPIRIPMPRFTNGHLETMSFDHFGAVFQDM